MKKEDYNKAECYVLHKDLSLRTEMRIALSEINVKCREFSKWQEVRAVLQMDTPSFMILSVDGDNEPVVDLLPKLRTGELSKNPFMPVAALTYYTDPDYHLRLIEASFNTHLQGPFSNRQLKDCVKFLSEDKRLYIANTEYIGPEPATLDFGASISQPIEAPNSLADHVGGKRPDFKAIDQKLGTVLHERVKDTGFNTLKFFNETITEPGQDPKQIAGKLARSCKEAKALINTDRFPEAHQVFDASESFCRLIQQRGFGEDRDREISNKLVDLMEMVVKDSGDPAAMRASLEDINAYINAGG